MVFYELNTMSEKIIYLGPWKLNSNALPQYWFRPILGGPVHCGMSLGQAEIFADYTTNKWYVQSYPDYGTDKYGSLDELKSWLDDIILKIHYGQSFDKAVFLSQEQFDKLSILT